MNAPRDTRGDPARVGPLEAGWLLLAGLVPLWVTLGARDPFERPKVFLFRTLVWLLIPLALATRRRLQPLAPRRPLLLLGGLIVASTLLAVDPALALWGSYERAQGALTLLSYLLLFGLVATHLTTTAQAARLHGALVGAAAALVLIALLQLATGWTFGLMTDARSPILATLGRANFLGALLAILLPPTLALARLSRERRARWALLLLAVGEGVVIVATLSRGAWLAAAVGLLLYAALDGMGHRRRLLLGAAGALAAVGPLAVLALGSGDPGSLGARRAIWGATLTLVAERPWLGGGADTLALRFPSVYPPELVYLQGRTHFVDRAHNLLLDQAVTLGLLGLLAALLLWAAVVRRGVAGLRAASSEPRTLLAATLAALGASATGLLVSFDVTATAVTTWLLGALVVALAEHRRARPVPSRRLPAAVLLLVALAGTWRLNLRPWLADHAALAAERHAAVGDWSAALAGGERAVLLWPHEPRYRLDLADYLTAVGDISRAHESLARAIAQRPLDPAGWGALARHHESTGAPGAADSAFARAVALAPNHATLHAAWGCALLARGDVVAAAPRLRAAVALDATQAAAYMCLGEAEMALGRRAVALADYREAVRLRPDSAEAQARLARAYWASGEPAAARRSLARARALDPDHPLVHELDQALIPTIDPSGGP